MVNSFHMAQTSEAQHSEHLVHWLFVMMRRTISEGPPLLNIVCVSNHRSNSPPLARLTARDSEGYVLFHDEEEGEEEEGEEEKNKFSSYFLIC